MLARVALLWSLVALTLGVAGSSAAATPFEVFLDVETEQDLYDALSAQQIDGATFERLRDLLARGVDLEVATRQELYELPNLGYGEVDSILAYRGAHPVGDGRALVAAGVLEEQSFLAIAPFLLARGSAAGAGGLGGWAQASARAQPGDRGAVPLGLRLRAFGFGSWSAGAAVALTRLRLDEVRYDPNLQALTAAAPSARLALPKLYVRREDGETALLLGSYRAGFGQRLVFDDTGAEAPAGFTFDDQLVMSGGVTKACKLSAEDGASPCGEREGYTTPDLRWREGLFGAAGSLKRVPLGAQTLALHAWASYTRRAAYQYELVDRARCPDPRGEVGDECAALEVRLPAGDPAGPARHAYQTLPSVVAETLVGAHASYGAGNRDLIGITAYLARTEGAVAGVELGARPSSRLPIGQRFGAVGVLGSVSRGGLQLSAEAARSFDDLPSKRGLSEGGGFGAVARLDWSTARAAVAPPSPAPAVSAPGASALELVARYYAPTFVNPYARPVAAPDEVEGQRARDEAGLRARASWTRPGWALRAALDGWSRASRVAPKLTSELRIEAVATPRWRLGAAASFDVTCDPAADPEGGSAGDGDGGSDGGSDGYGRLGCGAFSSRLRAALQATPTWHLAAQAQHDLRERQARWTFWLLTRRRSLSGGHLRAQLRYRHEDSARSAGCAGELRFSLGAASHLSLSLDAQLSLAQPSSSTSGPPNPVLSLGATYDVAL